MYRLLAGITAIFISLQSVACDLNGYRTTDQAAVALGSALLPPENNNWRNVSASQKQPVKIAINRKHCRNQENPWRNSKPLVETNSKLKDRPNFSITIDTDRASTPRNTAFNPTFDWQLYSFPFFHNHSSLTRLNITPNNTSPNQTHHSSKLRPTYGCIQTSEKEKQPSPVSRCSDRSGQEKKFANATQAVALDTLFDVKAHWLPTSGKRGSSFDVSFGSFDANKRFVRNLKPVFIS